MVVKERPKRNKHTIKTKRMRFKWRQMLTISLKPETKNKKIMLMNDTNNLSTFDKINLNIVSYQ